jgi:hypothetical protein
MPKFSQPPQAWDGRRKALDAAYYFDYIFFSGFVRGKFFLHVGMSWVKLFCGPYFNKIWNLMERKTDLAGFCCVLTGCFLHVETFFPLHFGG